MKLSKWGSNIDPIKWKSWHSKKQHWIGNLATYQTTCWCYKPQQASIDSCIKERKNHGSSPYSKVTVRIKWDQGSAGAVFNSTHIRAF